MAPEYIHFMVLHWNTSLIITTTIAVIIIVINIINIITRIIIITPTSTIKYQ
jgi:hypothetical protein